MAHTMTSLQSSKKTVRAAITNILRSLPESEVQLQSKVMTARILASPFFKQSKCVSCYLSMDGEANTSEIVREILRQGKTLYVPKISKGRDATMDFLKIYGLEDLDSLPSGVWGIKEPGAEWQGQRRMSVNDADAKPLDLILMPGVAFDRGLSRLGHGKGYYDRFLTAYTSRLSEKSQARPFLVALALKEQVLAVGEVPMGDRDWKVNMVVTSEGSIPEDHDVGQKPEVPK
ncbi:5-formyltetrahydrofolate cyclo-ligase, partial [Rickenella mellea]